MLDNGIEVFVAGGLGLETIGYSIIVKQNKGPFDRWLIAAEELFEMVGISIALFSSLLAKERTRQHVYD